MYYLEKTVSVSAAHRLALPYDSPCKNTHGHNWLITVYCRGDELIEGMLIDFAAIRAIVNRLDHTIINDVIADHNPTAEVIAQWIAKQVPLCWKVRVEETAGNVVEYVSGQ